MCDSGVKIQHIKVKGKWVAIDACIADIVIALNDSHRESGIRTIASCCGHGKQPGSIALSDGREIRIFSNYDDARKVDKLFPSIR